MTSVLYTPMDLSAPIQSGRRRFWKQLLPVTSIDYKGTKVDFDPEFHKDLQLSFEQKAYDQVPLVFADANNAHNMDPRNFGGELLDVKYRGPSKGTWGLIEADEDAAKAINKNPKLGVSARIMQGLNKADGRSFKRAINHVLLTMNPRVSGMEPWQAVDLSEDTDIEVVDLTAATYEEGNVMGRKTTKTTSGDLSSLDLSTLTDEEFQNLLDLAQTALDDEEVEDLDDVEDEDEVEVPPTTGKKRRHKSKTKITVEKDSEDDDADEEEDEEDEDTTDLSDADRVIKRGEVSEFRQMRLDLAEERWNRERDQYIDAGVPPFLLDLATPVLSQPESMTIDLSDDETIDATATIRKMLDGVKGIVDLSGEGGHAFDLSDQIEETDSATKFLDAWDKQYG